MKWFYGGLLATLILLTLGGTIVPDPIWRKWENVLGLRTFILNEKALHGRQIQDFSLASERWSEALVQDPGQPWIQFNSGFGMQLLERGEDAKKSYHLLDENPAASREMRFNGHFNLGVMNHLGKKTEEALKEYQEALELNPNSFETKVNIEFLGPEMQKQMKEDKDGKEKGNKDDKSGSDPSAKGKEQDSSGADGNKDRNEDPEKKKGNAYAPNPKGDGKEKAPALDPSDVGRILEEVRRQEKKIRNEYNRREMKEKPNDKDW